MEKHQYTQHHSLLTEFDSGLFKSGKHFKLYEKLGSHLVTLEGQDGTYFAVWAPNAEEVQVFGKALYQILAKAQFTNTESSLTTMGRF